MATGDITILIEACNRPTKRNAGRSAADHARAAIGRANAAGDRGDVVLARFWAGVAHHWERVAARNLTASITGQVARATREVRHFGVTTEEAAMALARHHAAYEFDNERGEVFRAR